MSATPSANLSSLEQKLEANPAAKIFLPLAEQHRLQGNLERASAILQSGLVHNPGYFAARVALGRVMLEQGQVTQGRLLLTALIAEVPDNLLAQKLLADAGGPLLAEDVEEAEAPEATADDALDAADDAAADYVAEVMKDGKASDTAEAMTDAGADAVSTADAEAAGNDSEAADDKMEESASLEAGGDEIEASPSVEPQEARAEDGAEAPDHEDESNEDGRIELQVPDAEELSFDVSEALDDEDAVDSVEDVVPDDVPALDISVVEDTLAASDQPTEPEEDEVMAASEPLASEENPAEMAGADEEVVWADPDSELPEPPSPEPGIWKTEDERAGVQEVGSGEDSPPAEIPSWDTPDSEFVVSETADQATEEVLDPDAAGDTEVTMESAETPGPEPFETVRLNREDLLLAFSETPPAEPEVAAVSPLLEAEHVPVEEVTPLSEPGEEAVQAATVMEAVGLDEQSLPDDISAHVAVSPQQEEAAERTLNLARLYRRQGRLDLASDVYRQVLDADPDDLAARRELEELCGQNVPEITDDDLVSEAAVFPGGVPVASTESLEDARQRKVMFLRAWLEHIRQQD